MQTKVVMVNAYRHKSGGYDLKTQCWEEASVSRRTEHPVFGLCYIGSFIAGVGMFNVHFPQAAVRLATAEEQQQLMDRFYAGCGPPIRLKPDDFATEESLKSLPLVPWDKL